MTKNEYIKRALYGDKNYHEIMTFFAGNALTKYAGFVPENTGEIKLPVRNHVNWQSKSSHMNIGILWVFHATENNHFGDREAWVIWHYGQVIKHRDIMIRAMRANGVDKRILEAFRQEVRDLSQWASTIEIEVMNHTTKRKEPSIIVEMAYNTDDAKMKSYPNPFVECDEDIRDILARFVYYAGMYVYGRGNRDYERWWDDTIINFRAWLNQIR